jgi:hypothetical protein
MDVIGWENIGKDFLRMTGQNYSKKQLKNRYTQIKSLATFWKEHLPSTGLGRAPNGVILASDSWWNENTKVMIASCPYCQLVICCLLLCTDDLCL